MRTALRRAVGFMLVCHEVFGILIGAVRGRTTDFHYGHPIARDRFPEGFLN